MHKVGKKILLLLAVVTVIAHSIIPHIHLEDIVALVNHQHHHQQSGDGHHEHDETGRNKTHHNLFSFAQLDEDFVPSKDQFTKFDLPIQYLSPVITCLPETFFAYIKQPFGQYNEHPPPGYFGYNLPSRGPPVTPLS